MDNNMPDASTYGAIFAAMLVVVIIITIAYKAVFAFYTEHKEREKDIIDKKIIFEGQIVGEGILTEGNQNIIYEDLTDEEADRVIKELLKTGKTNEKEIRKIESDISI